MKANTNKRLFRVCALGISLLLGIQTYTDIALAAETADFDLTVGAAEIVEADIDSEDEEFRQMLEEAQKEEEERNSFFMTNVDKAVNVRGEATTESAVAGKLYKDCGGKILERKEDWTKIQSGELEGWVSNEFLLFGDEAWALADEVGETTATVLTQALRVRKEPSEEAGVYGLLEINTEYTVIEELDEWVKIQYKNKEGYVFKEYVILEFFVDEGETIEEIKERERLVALEKAKLTAPLSPVAASEEDIYLLGAIIQCEAGNQTYEGKLAVGAVVCNRVRSSRFPGTIYDVIYSPGQFTPVSNGRLASRLEAGVNESCLQAAREAVAGATNVGTAHYFRRKGNKDGIIIGAHVFY